MKPLFLLVLVSIAATSCYSYHSLNNSYLEKGKTYNITDEKNEVSKIKVIDKVQDSLTVLKNGKLYKIADNKIKYAEERQVNKSKTRGLIIGSAVVVAIIVITAVIVNAIKHIPVGINFY